MEKKILYSKVWEYLRRYMNNPNMNPTRSQEVSTLLYNGHKSCRKVVNKLNHYCKVNRIHRKFNHYAGITIGELLDQAEPLNIDSIMSKRIKNLIKNSKYVY